MHFDIREMEYTTIDFRYFTRMSIILPIGFPWDTSFSCGVSYDSTYTKDSRTTDLNRRKACMELAKEIVYNVLPRVDFELKKEVNNYEIDNILSVLD